MKLCLSILAATATAESGALKEYEVQNAFFGDEQLTLSNARSSKQWHECGNQPIKPENGQGVMCTGNTCFAVCPIGWRSQGRWKIKCKADNTWSHSKFSPCVTCPDMSDELSKTFSRGVQVQEIVTKRNHAITQFFCGDSTLALGIKDEWFKKGSQKKNVKCLCRNGQNGDPAWKKSCSWSYQNALWVPSDVNEVTCGPYVEPTKPTLKDGDCFKDYHPNRVLSGAGFGDNAMTHERCNKFCQGFAYAGVQYSSQCYCGNDLPTETATNCNMKCAGNKNQICGGSWAMNVFSTY